MNVTAVSGIMTIKATFMNSSMVPPLRCAQRISKMYVFIDATIFVDKNLTLYGIDLNILADRWEIYQATTFNLNGIYGRTHERIPWNETGKPGKPGNGVTNPGNFFGLSGELINGHLLTVTLHGGNGEDAQDSTSSPDFEPEFVSLNL